jgi:hypothetical protein
MAIYVVTAVRLKDNGEVAKVRWARADGAANTFRERLHDVEVERVLQAFDHGDIVEMRLETANGTVSGGQLLRKVLPDGSQTIRPDRGGPGRTLHDLPRF